MPREITSIHHFIQCARRGRSKSASSGERVCHRLAANLNEIGDDIALLDYEALEGFILLCQLASGPWATEASKKAVFDHIRHAAS